MVSMLTSITPVFCASFTATIGFLPCFEGESEMRSLQSAGWPLDVTKSYTQVQDVHLKWTARTQRAHVYAWPVTLYTSRYQGDERGQIFNNEFSFHKLAAVVRYISCLILSHHFTWEEKCPNAAAECNLGKQNVQSVLMGCSSLLRCHFVI